MNPKVSTRTLPSTILLLYCRLDKVFQTFREINNVDEVKGAKAVFVADGEEDYVCSVVSELSQQMHNFAYQFRIDNDIS